MVNAVNGCFHKLGVPFVGVLLIRAPLFLGSIKVPLIFGNSHLDLWQNPKKHGSHSRSFKQFYAPLPCPGY